MKYQHIERLDVDCKEIEGLLKGPCYIFEKLDGTNGRIWKDFDSNEIKYGSRNQELSLDADNHGFMNAMSQDIRITDGFLFAKYPTYVFYGERMIKNTITYRPECLRKFMIFDIFDTLRGEYLTYEQVSHICTENKLDYIPVATILVDPTIEELTTIANELRSLYSVDGKPEGIVIKNYNYKNPFGRQTRGKIVLQSYKEEKYKPKPVDGTEKEAKFVEMLDIEYINKEKAKIVGEGEWDSKLIPKLMGITKHEFMVDNLITFISKNKGPVLDFGLINRLLDQKIKTLTNNFTQ
jgi:hypothetical protein